jgi:Acetyltransferase (GNAT) domain
MIDVRRYSPRDQPAWDDFVVRSKNATFLFRRGFMDYHSDRFIDHSLMAFQDGKLVGLLPASQGTGGTIVSHGGLTYGGMITDARTTAALALDMFRQLLDHSKNEAGFLRLHYKPVPHIYHRMPAEEDLHALFLCGAQLCRSDLSGTIALQAFEGFAKSKRAGIKVADRAGIVVTESREFASFWAMLAERLAERHGASPTHALHEIELLAGRFPNEIRLFVAKRQTVICAGILVFDCGNTVHTQYIASNEAGREVCAIDAIVAHLVTIVYRDRRWFDFGISTEKQGRELNLGLSRQKEMYGARTTVYQQFLIEL